MPPSFMIYGHHVLLVHQSVDCVACHFYRANVVIGYGRSSSELSLRGSSFMVGYCEMSVYRKSHIVRMICHDHEDDEHYLRHKYILGQFPLEESYPQLG